MTADRFVIIGVALVIVSVGALVAVAAGVLVGVFTAVLLLGVVLCWVGRVMYQWDQATEEPEADTELRQVS